MVEQATNTAAAAAAEEQDIVFPPQDAEEKDIAFPKHLSAEEILDCAAQQSSTNDDNDEKKKETTNGLNDDVDTQPGAYRSVPVVTSDSTVSAVDVAATTTVTAAETTVDEEEEIAITGAIVVPEETTLNGAATTTASTVVKAEPLPESATTSNNPVSSSSAAALQTKNSTTTVMPNKKNTENNKNNDESSSSFATTRTWSSFCCLVVIIGIVIVLVLTQEQSQSSSLRSPQDDIDAAPTLSWADILEPWEPYDRFTQHVGWYMYDIPSQCDYVIPMADSPPNGTDANNNIMPAAAQMTFEISCGTNSNTSRIALLHDYPEQHQYLGCVRTANNKYVCNPTYFSTDLYTHPIFNNASEQQQSLGLANNNSTVPITSRGDLFFFTCGTNSSEYNNDTITYTPTATLQITSSLQIQCSTATAATTTTKNSAQVVADETNITTTTIDNLEVSRIVTASALAMTSIGRLCSTQYDVDNYNRLHNTTTVPRSTCLVPNTPVFSGAEKEYETETSYCVKEQQVIATVTNNKSTNNTVIVSMPQSVGVVDNFNSCTGTSYESTLANYRAIGNGYEKVITDRNTLLYDWYSSTVAAAAALSTPSTTNETDSMNSTATKTPAPLTDDDGEGNTSNSSGTSNNVSNN